MLLFLKVFKRNVLSPGKRAFGMFCNLYNFVLLWMLTNVALLKLIKIVLCIFSFSVHVPLVCRRHGKSGENTDCSICSI